MKNLERSIKLTKAKFTTHAIVKIAILGAIAFGIMLIQFPIPIFPAFLKIDLSDIVALVGGFAIGPVSGVAVQLIKVLLHFIIRTSTGGVGELANFIIGASFVFPAAFIYHMKKDKKHALVGVIVGTITMTMAGALANIYILIPFYANIFPIEAIINMGTVINENITDVNSLVLYGITPFNIFKGIIISLVTMLIYKKISPILKSK
ncbi:MAG: ECF transporter S component [Alkaliphilus sp.]|nr:ECF transporter S component [bacterium AH-315-L21]MBN4062834.1 ECF transporter S component [Alkaliphilus sp. AH-315-G20]MBN4067564.1 ECF transporter S component [Alkaliphilus transvaalensis]MBN4069933.1 ECF transporter S component [bacterium AH-315-G05]PHS30029.1 MAG: ECF transporter S component [Alkaliphilus sp.]